MAHPISFLLALFIFIGATASDGAANSSSSYCRTYDCGNGVQIRYPFWLVDNTTSTQFCGYRGFGLTCSDSGEPILTLPTDLYYVKNINYDDNTLTLVDIDIANQPCPRARHNLSINADVPLFHSSEDLNLTFYFNCSYNSSSLEPIGCLGNGAKRSYVSIVGKETETETEDFNLLKYCEDKVVATVMESEISVANLIGGYGGAMKKGFVLDWRSLIYCGKCEAHDGLCGYNTTRREELCFCKDGNVSNHYCKGSVDLGFMSDRANLIQSYKW